MTKKHAPNRFRVAYRLMGVHNFVNLPTLKHAKSWRKELLKSNPTQLQSVEIIELGVF